MVFPQSRAFLTVEKWYFLSRGTSDVECGHISSPDKKEKVMKDL
jgi:hypothetical protein